MQQQRSAWAVAVLTADLFANRLWIHLTYQGVHAPYVDSPAWERIPAADQPKFWDPVFADMLRAVDTGM